MPGREHTHARIPGFGRIALASARTIITLEVCTQKQSVLLRFGVRLPVKPVRCGWRHGPVQSSTHRQWRLAATPAAWCSLGWHHTTRPLTHTALHCSTRPFFPFSRDPATKMACSTLLSSCWVCGGSCIRPFMLWVFVPQISPDFWVL